MLKCFAGWLWLNVSEITTCYALIDECELEEPKVRVVFKNGHQIDLLSSGEAWQELQGYLIQGLDPACSERI